MFSSPHRFSPFSFVLAHSPWRNFPSLPSPHSSLPTGMRKTSGLCKCSRVNYARYGGFLSYSWGREAYRYSSTVEGFLFFFFLLFFWSYQRSDRSRTAFLPHTQKSLSEKVFLLLYHMVGCRVYIAGLRDRGPRIGDWRGDNFSLGWKRRYDTSTSYRYIP